MNKITPLEFIKNANTYTVAERAEIVSKMSKEELLELENLLSLLNSMAPVIPAEPEKVNATTYEFRGEVYEVNEKDSDGREFATHMLNASNAANAWTVFLRDLRKYDRPYNKSALKYATDNVSVAAVDSIEESTSFDHVYNTAAELLFDLSKLWIVTYQNLYNAEQHSLYDGMKAGYNAYSNEKAVEKFSVLHNNIKLLSENFFALDYLSKRLPGKRYAIEEDGKVAESAFAAHLLLLFRLMKKTLIGIRELWNKNHDEYAKYHPDLWFETTVFDIFDKPFNETVNGLFDDLTNEITKLERTVEEYNENGFNTEIKAPMECCVKNPNVYCIHPINVKRFLDNPETVPEGVTNDDLRFYYMCLGATWDESAVVKMFHM